MVLIDIRDGSLIPSFGEMHAMLGPKPSAAAPDFYESLSCRKPVRLAALTDLGIFALFCHSHCSCPPHPFSDHTTNHVVVPSERAVQRRGNQPFIIPKHLYCIGNRTPFSAACIPERQASALVLMEVEHSSHVGGQK